MISKYRKAVFIVTYARTKEGIEYLLLKRKLHWKGWEFPKGGIKQRESERKAVKREVEEETGLKAFNIKKYNLKGKYKYDKVYADRKGIMGQTWELYSVEVKKPAKGKIKFDKLEHSDYKWLDFKKAIRKLTWPNQKKCLKIVDGGFLSKTKCI